MKSVSTRIWTRVAVSISNDDNNYTQDTFIYSDYIWMYFRFEYASSTLKRQEADDIRQKQWQT